MGKPASSLNAGEMLRRFTLGDRVILGSCVVFLIFSFFPWIGVDVGTSSFGVSFDQSGLHGWGVLAFIVMLVVAAFVMIRSPLLNNQVAVPALPLADWMLLLIGGVITLGATLLYWVEYHSSVDTGLGTSIGTSNRFGWYISLLAAIGICVGAYLKQNDPAPVAAGAGGGSVGGGYGTYSATPPPQPGYGPSQYGTPQPPPAPTEQAPPMPEQPPQPPPQP